MLSTKILCICNSDSIKCQLSDLLGEDYKYVKECFSVCDVSNLTEGSTAPLVIVAHEFVEDSIEDFSTFNRDNPNDKIRPLLLCDEFDYKEGQQAVNDGLFSMVIISRPLNEESKLVSLLEKAVVVCKQRASAEKRQVKKTSANYILAIEDDDFFAEFYKITLAELDEHVIVAPNCNRAAEFIYKRKPSLIFLDYKLPDFDGLEFLRTIRSDPDLKNIPVVVTGENQSDLQLLSIQLGAYKFIKKPIKAAEILKLVKEVKRQ
jgi:CheY-like chemotaxis protein